MTEERERKGRKGKKTKEEKYGMMESEGIKRREEVRWKEKGRIRTGEFLGHVKTAR